MSLNTNNLTPGRGRKTVILIGVAIFLICALVGFLMYRHHLAQEKASLEATLPSIKISLKNGCGFEGAASEMTEFLSDKNIEIVASGNAEKFIYNKTIIVVKKMDHADLMRLMEMTGISNWTLAESDYPIAPFIIIIGKDYGQLIQSQEKEKE